MEQLLQKGKVEHLNFTTYSSNI